MKQSFYQWLMTQRNPDGKDELANFANNASLDQSFPKQSEDYHEVAQYLELSGTYLPNMDIFDHAFEEYQALNQL